MPASYLFPFQHPENETKSRKRWFWLACEHRRIFGGIFKIIQVYERHDGANKMQIEQHKLFHIQCKEIGNNKYYEETTELEKWQSEILPE